MKEDLNNERDPSLLLAIGLTKAILVNSNLSILGN